jgi:hypothetical protein
MFNLEPGEQILKIAHRHWFVMLSLGALLVFMAVAPVVIYVFLLSGVFSLAPDILRSELVSHTHWGAFAYAIWVLLLWVMFFIEWTAYYLDMWIITNQRVVNFDQKGFFSREIITLRYGQIQDVTVEIHGIIPTWLKFGLIQIETAGETRVIEMHRMQNPEEVKQLIMQNHATATL